MARNIEMRKYEYHLKIGAKRIQIHKNNVHNNDSRASGYNIFSEMKSHFSQ